MPSRRAKKCLQRGLCLLALWRSAILRRMRLRTASALNAHGVQQTHAFVVEPSGFESTPDSPKKSALSKSEEVPVLGIVSGSPYGDRPSRALPGTANTYGVGVLREHCSLVEPARLLTLVTAPKQKRPARGRLRFGGDGLRLFIAQPVVAFRVRTEQAALPIRLPLISRFRTAQVGRQACGVTTLGFKQPAELLSFQRCPAVIVCSGLN